MVTSYNPNAWTGKPAEPVHSFSWKAVEQPPKNIEVTPGNYTILMRAEVNGEELIMEIPVRVVSEASSEYLCKPEIEITPSNPLVGDLVQVNVKLTYVGTKETVINPFMLRSKYSINLTVKDVDKDTIYLLKRLSYVALNTTNAPEKTILVKPGDSFSLGYTEVTFLAPHHYLVEARVSGPELISNDVMKEVLVNPGSTAVSYEAINETDNWVLDVTIKPKNITTEDNLTIDIQIRYVGNESFRIDSPNPLLGAVYLIHVNGIDSWGVAIPSIISSVNITPGFIQTFRFIVGPKASSPHNFKPGIYRVEVYATGCEKSGELISISALLFVKITKDRDPPYY